MHIKSMNDVVEQTSDRPLQVEGKRVSVIIPLYNAEAYIEKCLTSVFEQTERSIEIILVDDASSDASVEAATRMEERCPASMSVTICRREKNSGPSAARNQGIGIASGDYLYFLDSDDWITADCIEILLEEATSYELEVCSGDFEYWYGDDKRPQSAGKNAGFRCYCGDEILAMFSRREVSSLLACNKLILRSFVTEHDLGFEEGLHHEDNLWNFSLAARARNWGHAGVVTYYYRQNNSGSITAREDVADRTCWLFRVLELMKKDIDRLGGPASGKFPLLALNMLALTKCILWGIECGSGERRRALYAEFRKYNVFQVGNEFYEHLSVRYKFFAMGWNLAYPACRFFSPYYLANLRRHAKKGDPRVPMG